MIIDEIRIHNFGKLHNRVFAFKDGLNIIHGKNESGKSTLHTFIKCMLFDIQKSRGRAAKTDEYTRYLPWENPGWFAGVLRFRCGDKMFRLDRTFLKGMEKAELICETDGEMLSIEDGDLEMLLGNLSRAAYENTISVGQMKSRTTEALAEEVQNYLANYRGSMDGRLDVRKILQILKEKKKELERKRQEKQAVYEAKIQRLDAGISYVQREQNRLEEQILENQKRNVQSVTKEKKEHKKSGLYPAGICVIAVYLLIWIIRRLPLWMLALPIFLAGIMLWTYLRENEEVRQADQEFAANEQKMQGKLEILRQEYKERETQLSNLLEEKEELERNEEMTDQEEEKMKAIDLAMERISILASGMQNMAGERLQKRTGEILCEITEGAYPHILLDEKMQISLYNRERYIPLYQVSIGTIEQVYLALRIAAGEMLGEEEMPLFLDETFVFYDEERLLQSLRWLEKSKRQVFLFTCSEREINLIEKYALKSHTVEL